MHIYVSSIIHHLSLLNWTVKFDIAERRQVAQTYFLKNARLMIAARDEDSHSARFVPEVNPVCFISKA